MADFGQVGTSAGVTTAATVAFPAGTDRGQIATELAVQSGDGAGASRIIPRAGDIIGAVSQPTTIIGVVG